MPTDKFQRWVNDLQKAQPVHPDQTKQTILSAMHPKRRKWPWIVSTITVAMIIFGVSAATLQPVQEVLAKIPIVKWMVSTQFGNQEGDIVAKSGQLQSVNVTQTSNGITMKISSAYVVGRSVAVSGVITGAKLNDQVGRSGRTLDYEIDAPGYKFGHDGWSRVTEHKYTFEAAGTISKAASQQKKVKLPISFTSVMGVKTNLHFNLSLKPSKVIVRQLKGSTTNESLRVKLQRVEQYSGGISSMKLLVTDPHGDENHRLQLDHVYVNGSKRDAYFGILTQRKISSKVTAITIKTRPLPKRISTLTFQASRHDIRQDAQYRLDQLPQTLTIPDSPAVYHFQPAQLVDGRVTFDFSLSGSRFSDDHLQGELFKYGLYLQLTDQKAWQKVGQAANDQGKGINDIVFNSIWINAKHQFHFSVDLPNTPLEINDISALTLNIPLAVQPVQNLKPLVMHVQ